MGTGSYYSLKSDYIVEIEWLCRKEARFLFIQKLHRYSVLKVSDETPVQLANEIRILLQVVMIETKSNEEKNSD